MLGRLKQNDNGRYNGLWKLTREKEREREKRGQEEFQPATAEEKKG